MRAYKLLQIMEALPCTMASLSVRGATLYSATSLWAPLVSPRCASPNRSSVRFADRHSLLCTETKANWKSSNSVSKYLRRSVAKSFVCSAALDTSTHEFFDDGAELEVRVRIPDGMVGEDHAPVSARHVNVDSQDTALFIAVRSPQGPRMIFSAMRLYGRVKPAETVWYIDDSEIVLSLKKTDDDVKWPSLEEAWASLTEGVSQLLKGTSVYVVGGSTDINWAVAKELAAGLEYVPLQTQQLIQDYINKSPVELAAEEGDKSVTETESAILDSLSSHVRCVVSTLGGSPGVGAQLGNWRSLHAGFTVWINQTTATDEETAEQEAARAKQDGSKAYAQADVVVALGGWDENSARPAAEGALRALKAFLEGDKELPGKKSMYVRLGCRGDWPDIMPPGWNPLSGKEEAKSTAYY
uniref:CS domain-containing protein n=3 Tax=Physcomitrium patens TaxID=3218 RepID=A0A7I4ADC7_PHYPA